MTQETATPVPRIEFLSFEGCPNTPLMREHLYAAVTGLGWKGAVVEVDLTSLGEGDERMRFGSPTVLVNGSDLFGEPLAAGSSLHCRVYPGGIPRVSQIAERLLDIGILP